jgi:AraC-like DNA-binding protein
MSKDFITAPRLIDVISNYLIPVIEDEGLFCITLAQAAWRAFVAAEGVEIVPRKRRGRAESVRGSQTVIRRWRDDHQIALSLPYFCFVFAGEADFYIGDAILRCPQNRGVLIPPGTPLSDGSQPHWERDQLENAHSDILWIKFHPFGMECHTCHTRGSTHYGGGFGERSMISNRQFFVLVEMLMEELLYRRPSYEVLSRAYLLSLFTLLKRHLEEEDALPRQAHSHFFDKTSETPALGPEVTLRRITQYIQNNLGNSFTLQDIARAAYISRSTLAALFREHTGQTVWEYVTEQRMAEAKAMLTQTDISIENIARLIGFPNPSHFATRFARYTGVPPREFRLQTRRGNTALKPPQSNRNKRTI